MATCIYHQEKVVNGKSALWPQEHEILKDNGDGTFDIGPKGGEPIVTKVKLSDKPQAGFITKETGAPSSAKK